MRPGFGLLSITNNGSSRGMATGPLQRSGTNFLRWLRQLEYLHEMSREPGAVQREVAIVKSGGSAPQGEIYFLGGKHPFVRVQHLDVDTDHVQHWDLITDEAVQRYHLQKFPAGTIVFPKSGASIRL